MNQKNKKERIIESLSKVQVSKSLNECQDNMLEMLWRIAEGTRYESDVSVAFDCLRYHFENVTK
ncbi:hypothetical protein [Bacillus pumilus]|uniref:Uncharacterized protein n=1 Tax=Bacillus pumilus TaxID=1408 RepID=A0AAD0HP66_BACPU|nr:hypothetical protein [Bacillus pumilus]AVM24909.1 hypothetical protein C5695_14050 [Bacillus pumilus]TYS42013.1 hypothetical protein FZC68_10835 [Bacillus pumilus]